MIKYICILIALCGSVLLHGTMYEAILNELMHEQKQEQNFLKKLSIDLLKTYDSFLKKIPSPPHSSMKNLQTDFIKIIGEKSGIRALSAVPKEPAKIIQLCVNRIEGWKDEVEKLLSQLPKDQHNEYKTLYALIKNFDQALEQLPLDITKSKEIEKQTIKTGMQKKGIPPKSSTAPSKPMLKPTLSKKVYPEKKEEKKQPISLLEEIQAGKKLKPTSERQKQVKPLVDDPLADFKKQIEERRKHIQGEENDTEEEEWD